MLSNGNLYTQTNENGPQSDSSAFVPASLEKSKSLNMNIRALHNCIRPPKAYLSYVLSLVVILLSSGLLQSQVNVTLTSTKATYSYEEDDNDVYGTDDVLSTEADPGARTRGFVEFDLSSIPLGSTITAATLRLVHANIDDCEGFPGEGDDFDVFIRRVTRDWVEGTTCDDTQTGSVSWTSAGPTNWTTPGGDFAATDYGSFNAGNGDADGLVYTVNVLTLVNK